MDERVSQIDGRNPTFGVENLSGGLESKSPTREELDDQVLAGILRQLREGRRLWLFLDYDGTMVDIARTPDEARPDGPLLRVLAELGSLSNVRTVILSGRPLFSLQAMLRVPGIVLAGLYGVEIQMPDDHIVQRADPASVRVVVEKVKAEWAKLIGDRQGFLLEDKGMAVALHSRRADGTDADQVEPAAAAIVARAASEQFRILGGEHFLELAPATAHKGKTVTWLLSHHTLPNGLPVYFGDDDKDEEAFAVIREYGGIPVIVGSRQPNTRALARIKSPVITREWLKAVSQAAQEGAVNAKRLER